MSEARMSETTELHPQHWVWQGWFVPMADAVAAKRATDADSRAGVWVPVQGEPPARGGPGGHDGHVGGADAPRRSRRLTER